MSTIDAKQKRQVKYAVGIDTGTSVGYAVWDCTLQKLIEVKTYTAHEAWAAIRTMKHVYGADAIFIRFEDARLRTWYGNSGHEKLQGAGSIKRDAVLWQEFCEMEGIRYEAVAPKNNKTKTDAKYFARLTGWERACSVHGRDGAMLVVGWKEKPAVFNAISY
jgi:hypothetical protein